LNFLPSRSRKYAWVADQLDLGLSALEFFAGKVGEYGRDLAVAFLVGDDFGLAVGGVGDATVAVAEREADGCSLRVLRVVYCGVGAHCGSVGGFLAGLAGMGRSTVQEASRGVVKALCTGLNGSQGLCMLVVVHELAPTNFQAIFKVQA